MGARGSASRRASSACVHVTSDREETEWKACVGESDGVIVFKHALPCTHSHVPAHKHAQTVRQERERENFRVGPPVVTEVGG